MRWLNAGDTGDAATTPWVAGELNEHLHHTAQISTRRGAKTTGELSELPSHEFTLSPTKQRTVVSHQVERHAFEITGRNPPSRLPSHPSACMYEQKPCTSGMVPVHFTLSPPMMARSTPKNNDPRLPLPPQVVDHQVSLLVGLVRTLRGFSILDESWPPWLHRVLDPLSVRPLDARVHVHLHDATAESSRNAVLLGTRSVAEEQKSGSSWPTSWDANFWKLAKKLCTRRARC